jgi:hypothetical protein
MDEKISRCAHRRSTDETCPANPSGSHGCWRTTDHSSHLCNCGEARYAPQQIAAQHIPQQVATS